MAKWLSKGASTVLRAAEAEARARRQAVGTPHLLLALLADHDGAPAHALAAMGFTVGDVRHHLRRTVGTPAGRRSRGRPHYSTRAESILGRALAAAQRDDRTVIEPTDLLMAVVAEPEGKATAVLNTLRRVAEPAGPDERVTASH